ncbi:MAG: RNA polymerase sigma-70 factor [Pseudonocardiaceae bacterium]
MSAVPDDVREFEAARPRLFALAYRLLGSASEAEDAVQDTFLRWNGVDRALVVVPAAWLAKVVTNLCLNRLTSASARREDYVGPWLPEPVLTADPSLDPMETIEQRESVSLGFLVLLERLTPAERAVFVLREAFAYSHREIADILELTEANSQQLYRRARAHVSQEHPRFDVSGEQEHRITERFLAAARGGDLAGLEHMLAADVVAWADGGGKAPAARRPVRGAEQVARYLSGWMSRPLPGLEITVAEVNGQPGILGVAGGRLLVVMVLELAGDCVSVVRTIANPDKLSFISGQLSRLEM